MTVEVKPAIPNADDAAAAATAAAATAAAAAAAQATQTPEQKAAAEKATADAAAAAAAAGTKDEGKGSDDKGSKDAAAAAAAKAPAKYELTVPDESKTFVDAEDLTEFEQLARTNDWSQEDAQAFVLEQAAQRKGMSDKFHAAAIADKEIGGAQLPESQARAKRVLDRFLPDTEGDGKALRTALTKLGLGSYPPLVRLLVRIDKASAEDSPITSGAGTGGGSKDAATSLYDHPTSKALDAAAAAE